MPEMHITMRSTEHLDANRLDYHFESTFPRNVKARSNKRTLYIALDFHKYEQLMAMQSAFKEAIEKALVEIGHSPARPVSAGSASAILEIISEKRESEKGANYGESDDSSAAAVVTWTPARPVNPNTDARVDSGVEGGTEVMPSESTVVMDMSTAPDLALVKVGLRGLTYHCLSRTIETPKLHQLGAASPDLETFKQWTNISIRDSLPVWIHEYATIPLEQLMRMMLELYIKQLKDDRSQEQDPRDTDEVRTGD
jgi:hypothetical protein